MGLNHVWYRTMGADGLQGVLRGGLLGWIVFGIKQGVWRVTVSLTQSVMGLDRILVLNNGCGRVTRSFAWRVTGLDCVWYQTRGMESYGVWSRFGFRWWAVGFDKMSVDFIVM